MVDTFGKRIDDFRRFTKLICSGGAHLPLGFAILRKGGMALPVKPPVADLKQRIGDFNEASHAAFDERLQFFEPGAFGGVKPA